MSIHQLGDDHVISCGQCGTLLTVEDSGFDEALGVARCDQWMMSNRFDLCPACASLLKMPTAEKPFQSKNAGITIEDIAELIAAMGSDAKASDEKVAGKFGQDVLTAWYDGAGTSMRLAITRLREMMQRVEQRAREGGQQ